METLKERIIGNHECFNLTLTTTPTVHKLLTGESAVETLFFVQEDNGKLVFCRMKLPNEIEPDDFFTFTEKYFDKLIEEGKVELF